VLKYEGIGILEEPTRVVNVLCPSDHSRLELKSSQKLALVSSLEIA